jgi:hypothetical protein
MDAADLGYFAQLAHVLSLWHLRRGYVDTQACPRPLRLSASGPSLSKLIAMVFPRANPKAVLATLIRVGAVYQRGQHWLPRGRTLVFKSAHVARLRILSDLARFLRTAQHNVAHPRGKLLQLSAFNPEIPAAEFPELHARIHERAKQFVIEHDTALSRHEGTARGLHRSTVVGIGVYVFRDPPAVPRQMCLGGGRLARDETDEVCRDSVTGA